MRCLEAKREKQRYEELARELNLLDSAVSDETAEFSQGKEQEEPQFDQYDELSAYAKTVAVTISGGGIKIPVNQEFDKDEFILLEIFVPSSRFIADVVARVVFSSHSDNAADDRLGEDADGQPQMGLAGDRPDHPVRQTEQKENGRRIDHQLVLEHVRAEKITFAGLVEGRTYGQIENDESAIELQGMATRIGHTCSSQPLAPRTGQNGIKPAKKYEPANQEGFVVPVGPINHQGQRIEGRHGMATKSAVSCASQAGPVDEAGRA